ncbi:hypothetical protein MAP00_001522 [Monascus purpureus]|nr:hypothetical protein MAP00_001522 [Monascus purpureus]
MSRPAIASDASLSTSMSDRPLTKSSASETKPNNKWNTDKLGLRLGVDTLSATLAGALTCPIVTIIDRAIIEKAAKGFPIARTTMSCLKDMVTRPTTFFLSTPFLLIYTLYTSTYWTANAIDTVTSTLRNQPFSTVTPGLGKFLATTTVNMSICVYKDARFAKIFGAPPAPAPAPTPSSPSSVVPAAAASSTPQPLPVKRIPITSYTLFCLRDSVTIFASFNVPPLLAPRIPDFLAPTDSMKMALAQFSCPALMQFISTPMHLLGLDLYNRQPPGGLSWKDRASRIRRDYIASSFARMGKIVPAYGVGGVANVWLRKSMMEWVEGSE